MDGLAGICHVEPSLPKLLILSQERIGVVDPPEYVYQEYDSKGTLRCDLMIFVERSTRYPNVDPWFISTTSFRFPDTYRKAARKALRRLRAIYKHPSSGLLWDLSRRLKEEGAHGLPELEDLEKKKKT